jgi:hypothetical protein
MSSTMQRLLTERQARRIGRATDDVNALLNEAEAAKRARDQVEALAKYKAAMVLAMDKLRTELVDVGSVRPDDAMDFYVSVTGRMVRLMQQVHTHKPRRLGQEDEGVANDG